MTKEQEMLENELDMLNNEIIDINIQKDLVNSVNFITNKIIEIEKYSNNKCLGNSMRIHLVELKNTILADESGYKNSQIQILDNLLTETNIKIQEITSKIEEII